MPRSLTSSKKVYVERDVTGTDPPFVGVEWMPTPVSIRNGKCCRLPAHAESRILHPMPMVARVAAAKRLVLVFG